MLKDQYEIVYLINLNFRYPQGPIWLASLNMASFSKNTFANGGSW